MNKKILIRRLISYMGRRKALLPLSFVFSVLYAVCAMFIPLVAGRAIDALLPAVDFEELTFNIIIMAVLILFASVFQYLYGKINNNISYDVIRDLRNDAYGKIGKLPVSFIDGSSTGSLQSMIISDSETVGDGLILFLNQFFTGITSIIFTLGIMIFIDVRTALFVLIFTPLSFIFAELIARGSFKSFKEQSGIRSVQTSFIAETTANFKTGFVFDMSSVEKDRFDKINEDYRNTSGKAAFLSSITNPCTRFINALIYAGVAFIGSGLATGNLLTIGKLASLLSYSNQFMKPFNDLSSVYTEMSDSLACLDRIFRFLDEEELKEDLKDMTAMEKPFPLSGGFEIEFRNVSFSYVPGKPVLSNVSFKIKNGMSCALVGPTGCGKTTVINLLMRFYEPQEGAIYINGVNIADIKRNQLRSLIGTVSQDTWFKDGSVMDNIRFGKPEADDSECKKAAYKTGADSFITGLAGGYDEIIGNDRDDLSEGQRQLLSITRAMAADPSILILDEATSSVDIKTEVKIQRAVKEILAGRTGIIIAHRLSTIIDSDMIVVIEGGRVSDIGTHEKLLSKGGFYSKLYGSYVGEEMI